jgi:hypothetical protein
MGVRGMMVGGLHIMQRIVSRERPFYAAYGASQFRRDLGGGRAVCSRHQRVACADAGPVAVWAAGWYTAGSCRSSPDGRMLICC